VGRLRISLILDSIGVLPRITLWLIEAFVEEATVTYLEAHFGIVVWLFLILALGGLVVFPWKSIKNPWQFLSFSIEEVIYAGILKIQPFIEVKIVIRNNADVTQTIETLTGNLKFTKINSIEIRDTLQYLFPISVPAKGTANVDCIVHVSEKLAKKLKVHVDKCMEIRWDGDITAKLNMKVVLPMKQSIQNYSLQHWKNVPQVLSNKVVQEMMEKQK